MKIISIITFIILAMVDLMMIYMIAQDLRYCNRHTPEDFILFLIGGLLFFGISVYLTFCIGCMALSY